MADWRGPIETRGQAERIMGRTGWTLLGFGALCELAAFYPRFDLSVAIFMILLFMLPALALAKSRTVWAARWFYVLSGFAFGMSVATAFYGLSKGESVASGLFGVAVFWLMPMWASMRAAKAAKWLKNSKQTEGPEGPDGLVFE